jgi:hypothetical protein
MSNPITNCEGCVFVSLDSDDNQKGCQLQRPIMLGVEQEDKYYTLSRFCNTYRPADWASNLNFAESLSLSDTVLNEVRPRLGFFVILDTSAQDAISELKTTIDSIVDMNGDHSYIVVINDKVEYNEEIWELFNPLKESNPDLKYVVMQLTSSISDQMVSVVDHAFQHAQNGWIMCVNSGTTVAPSVLDGLHNFINIEMRQLILVEPQAGINGLAFPAYLFKFLNGNKTKIFNDEMTDSRKFLEKVKDAEQRGGTKTVYSWDDIMSRLPADGANE